MKKITLLLTVCLALTLSSLWAQKVAVVGMNHISSSPNRDGFSFVALQDLTAVDIIYFTERIYDANADAFTGTDSFLKFVPSGTITKGTVVFLRETGTSTNVFDVICTGGGVCGTATNLGGSFSLSTNGDNLYAYEDTDDDITNGITTIYALMYTGSGSAPIQNGGNVPFNQNPTSEPNDKNINAIVVDGFPNDNNDFVGPDRVEFKFSPATERENVSKSGLENPNNYVSYVPNQDLSTVVFTNVLPTAADPVIVLSASANALNEDANGTITLTATLDAPAASNLTVDLSIGGTAADQIDFTTSNIEILISSGATTGSITISPILDGDLEPDETVIVTIVNGAGYDPGSPSSQTVTILNDDTLAVTPVVAMVGSTHSPPISPESFSFVALDDIAANTQVYFTENPFDNSLLNFSGGEGVAVWTAPAGGVTRGQVIVVTEDSSNTFTTSCDSGTCGTVTYVSGNWDLASQGEAIFAYTDSDTDHTNGIGEISSVLFTGTTSNPGGNIPASEDPSGIYLGSVVVDGFAAEASERTEYNPALRGVSVDQANFQNTANWLHSQPTGTLSTVPFSNIIIATGSADPSVTVTAAPTSVLEDSGTGMVFTFTLSEAATADITVNFTVGGTAVFVNNTTSDYAVGGVTFFSTTAGTVLIPNGSTAAQVTVTPLVDADVETQETINLMVASGTGYVGGSPNDAEVSIINDDTSDSMPLVAIVGLNHDSFTSPNVDGFSFVAARDIPANTTIYFTENEFDNTTLEFTTGEAVMKWVSPGAIIPKGDVIVATETGQTTNTFDMTCSVAGSGTATCGEVTMISGNFAVDTSGETFYAYEDDDDDPSNGVSDIYAVLYTGDSGGASGGSLPAMQDPSGIFLNALVVDGFPNSPPNRTEYEDTKRNVPVNQADFENISNWLFGQLNTVLSAVPFTNLDIVDTEPPVITCPTSITQSNDPGFCTAAVALVDPTATDNVSTVFTFVGMRSDGAPIGDPFPVGITSITWTAEDEAGNVSLSCDQTVTINDTEPPVAVCQDITVQLDTDGNGSIIAADINGGSSDNCNGFSLSVSPNTFTVADVGQNVVTLTATDDAGNTASCTANITVEDNELPTAICQDVTLVLDGNGQASLSAAEVDNGSNDAAGIASLSVSPSTFTCGDLGANSVTLTVTDNNGNVSFCSATITVEDTMAPMLTCGGTITQSSVIGFPVDISITPPSVTDNCDGSPIVSGVATRPDTSTFNLGPTTADYTFTVGTTTILWSAMDAEGNNGTCTQTVMVSQPATVPVPNVVGQDQATAEANIAAANLTVGTVSTAFDNTVPAGAVVSQNPVGGGSIAPTSPVDLVVSLGPQPVFDLALRKTTISSGPYLQGSTVTYQIEVINQGNQDATNVEVTDYIPTGLNLTDGAWAQSGSLATRTIAGPIAANGGTGTITITFQIDANFQGTSLVNYAEISNADNTNALLDMDSAYDQDNTNDAGGQPNSPADNEVNGDGTGIPGDGIAATDEDDHDSAQISVDVEDPAVDCSAVNAARNNDPGQCSFTMSGTGFDATATDNVGVSSLTNDFNNGPSLAGESFPVGTTTVTWTAMDAAGNTASCSFDIVITDSENPVISCPTDITVESDPGVSGAVVTFADITATDNCTFDAGGTVISFNYTGVVQTYTVPAGITSIHIEAVGANNGFSGFGLGAKMSGDFSVTPGQVLDIVVGAQGTVNGSTSSGGGGSGVSTGGTALIVAGGGGGVNFADRGYSGLNAVLTQDGMPGNLGGPGGTAGGNGGDFIWNDVNFSRGGKGFIAATNGSTGEDGTSPLGPITPGTFGLGGGGGSVGNGYGNTGGGGGGYSGGGAGSVNRSGGGGGSFNIGTNQGNEVGAGTGDGLVTITVPESAVTQTAGLPSGSVFPEGTTTNTFMVMDASGNIATCSFDVTVGPLVCPDNLPNEDPAIVLSPGLLVGGLDTALGTDSNTNNSFCALEVCNNAGNRPWARYRIPIDLAANGIEAGDRLQIQLDGDSTFGRGRVEINQNDTPNTTLAQFNFGTGWSSFDTTITVPAGLTTLDIWLFSTYNKNLTGCVTYDNLRVVNLDGCATGLQTYYADVDGDGYGDPNNSVEACTQPDDFVADNTDCNDGDAAVNPAAIEVCDGIDNNCDGMVDEGLAPEITVFVDGNIEIGDNANAEVPISKDDGSLFLIFIDNDGNCDLNLGTVTIDNGWFVDSQPTTIAPGTRENLFVRLLPEDVACPNGGGPVVANVAIPNNDADEDPFTFTISYIPGVPIDNDGDGFTECSGDCNDGDATIFPGALEVCDGIDNNCDGQIDEGTTNTYYADTDGDGYGDPNNTIEACTQTGGYVSDNTDCNDNDPSVNPGAVEVCDGIDNNCDGQVDEGLNCVVDCPDALPNEDPAIVLPVGSQVGGIDAVTGTDLDTFGSPCAVEVTNNDAGQPWGRYRIPIVLADHGIEPGDRLQIQVDGKDGTGNARIEVNRNNTPNTTLALGNFGSGWSSFDATVVVPSGLTTIDLWFFSNYAQSGPGTAVYDNLRVVNLDGVVPCGGAGFNTYYADTDGDSYGDPNNSTQACSRPVGFVDNDGDCNDNSNISYPGAPEICDGIDNDCDGVTDDGLGSTIEVAAPSGITPFTTSVANGDALIWEDLFPGIPIYSTSGSLQIDFTICNTGNCELVLSDVITATGFFTIIQPSETTLSPSNCTTFTLLLNGIPCPEGGPVTTTVTIANNTMDDDPFSFTFSLTPQDFGTPDADGDGVSDFCDVCQGDDATGDADGDGYCADVDCNDNSDVSFPGAPEICDGIDNNCDGNVDEGLTCTVDCPDALPNEDPAIVLPAGSAVGGIDAVTGTNTDTNGSPCAVEVTNNDAGQPWGRYRIPIVLADYGLTPGDQLLIEVDGKDGTGNARIEVNRNNTPNTTLALGNFGSAWSRFSQVVTVPSGVTTLDLWFFSNYANSASGGTAVYDNLVVVNLSVPPRATGTNVQANLNNMHLYPNPATEAVQLEFDEPTQVQEFQVFDLLGRLVRTIKVDPRDAQHRMTVLELPVGTYFVKTTDAKGQEFQQRMVIKR